MKRALIQTVVLGLAIAGVSLLQAQAPGEESKPRIPTQDPSELTITRTLEQGQQMISEAIDESSPVLQAVVRFLQLRPDQVEALEELLAARREAVAPLLQAITEREKRLRQLLESGGTPPDIGQVVIEIHELQKQVVQAQHVFLAKWQELLDEEQRQRLEAVRLAARLQPVLPAFQQLNLL